MDAYTESYLRNHCIDVFFRSNGRAVHIVTDGCLLPNALTDVLTNRRLQHEISMLYDDSGQYLLDEIFDVEINQAYIELIRSRVEALGEGYIEYMPDAEHLLQYHKLMSQIGFYSYACVWDDIEETHCRFILVSSPRGNQCHIPNNMILPNLDEQHIHWGIGHTEFCFLT